ISCAVYFLRSISTDQLVPMCRFTERTVRSGLVIAWRLATSPTSTSPVFEKPTTEGVVRPPSALGTTVGSPASRTATTELVVPRSIPTALGMWACPPTGYWRLVDWLRLYEVERSRINLAGGPVIPGSGAVFSEAARTG